jgi:dTMP kinase
MSSVRGKLIVIEGLDRAGKSTQVERLATHLAQQGQKAERIRFPDRTTPIGKSIDAYLKGQAQIEDHVIHLLFSANRWEAAENIKAKLNSGINLVVDRYSFSGAVYSAAKRNPTLDLNWAWQQEIGLPQPDLVIYLTITPAVAASRGGFGDERYENQEMQRSVREMFEELWERWDGNVVILNADGTLDEIQQRVTAEVDGSFKPDFDRQLGLLGPLKNKK